MGSYFSSKVDPVIFRNRYRESAFLLHTAGHLTVKNAGQMAVEINTSTPKSKYRSWFRVFVTLSFATRRDAVPNPSFHRTLSIKPRKADEFKR